MKPATPILVILGLGDDRKPRAARFDTSQLEVARKAAKAMGLRVGTPKTDEAKALAMRLVPGRLYATGKGLIPLVKTATYDELLAKLELEGDDARLSAAPEAGKDTGKAASGDAKPGSAVTSNDTPSVASADKPDPAALWAAITVGSTVIAPEARPSDDGWWRATVVQVSKDGRNLTLRWLDAPKQPPVTLKRQAVALLYPA